MNTRLYLKFCYRLLSRSFESRSLANDFSWKLYQADITMSGGMFLSALLISSLLISFITGIVFSFLHLDILPPFIIAVMTFFLCIGAVYLQLTSKIQNKGLAIDHELPFALSHMSLIASTGASPLNLIRMVASSDHGAVSTEFKKILYAVDIQGKDVVSAILKLARITPSLHLRSLLLDITRIAHTGGNMEAYFHDRLDHINELKRQMQKDLAQSLAIFSEMYITMISVGVIMSVLGVTVGSVLMEGKIGPFSAGEFFDMTIYFLIPLANVIFFALLVLKYSPYGLESKTKNPKPEQIYVRKKLKREHFTLLLPVTAAVLLVAGSFFMGQMAESASVVGGVGIDQIMVIAVLVAITPYSIDVYIAKKRRDRYEEEFAGFLYELSELLRGGLDPISAIKEIASPTVESERSLRTLGPHLKKAVALLDWGRPFETAITSLAESLKSPLISKYSYLIVQASRMGGANAATILKSSEDLEKTLLLQREKDGMLREYLFIIYSAQFILIAILYLLNTTLLPSIIGMLKSGVGAAFGISAAATSIDFKQGFFHVIMINAFASGIITGQLTEGKARHGLKHSVILIAISYAASLIFLLR